jgi:molecular chaperone DnaK
LLTHFSCVCVCFVYWSGVFLQNKAKDAERRARIEARNKLDGTLYDLEQNMEKFKDKIPQDEADALKEEMKSVREKMNNDKTTAEELTSAGQELQQKSLKLFSHVYQQAGAGGAQAKPEEQQQQQQQQQQ